jgi:hypothetical protein
MEVAWISPSPIDSSPARAPARPTTAGGDFAAAISAETGESRTKLERAEALVGTRIRAPEGGCGCDALISTVAPPEAAAKATAQLPDVAERAPLPSELEPGSIISFSPASDERGSVSNDLTDHLHRAIVRNASEMITANEDGMIEVLGIPWRRITSAT